MDNRKKILIVDDNLEICELVKKYGDKVNVDVTYLTSSDKCIDLMKKQKFDLLILDVSMPKINGFELFELIRKQYDTPILFLSAKIHITDRIKGLKLGAEDYIVKPFSLEELFIKIEKIIQRYGNYKVQIDEFEFDVQISEIKKNGEKIRLTHKEFLLLLLLAKNKGLVLSRERILSEVWNINDFLDARTVDTHVKSLRKKIGSSYIKTIRNEGYMYEENKDGVN